MLSEMLSYIIIVANTNYFKHFRTTEKGTTAKRCKRRLEQEHDRSQRKKHTVVGRKVNLKKKD